jgi:tetratricopeptide (TPR) repeat protein
MRWLCSADSDRCKLHLLSVLLVCLMLVQPVEGCLQHYGTSVDGREVPLKGLAADQYVSILAGARPVLGTDVPEPLSEFQRRSNEAVSLIYKGDHESAIEILEQLEQAQPGEYQIAANLGTAYELAGNLDSALIWIQEGIRRNPNSHHGTEWLHVNILNAKIALATDPEWLKTHSVSGMDFGKAPAPSMPEAAAGDKGTKLIQALEYQLRERLKFSPPPDPIVGDLLMDLASIHALTSTVEHGISIGVVARLYQPAKAGLLDARMREFYKAEDAYNRKVIWIGMGIAAILGAATATAVVLSRIRRIRKLPSHEIGRQPSQV